MVSGRDAPLCYPGCSARGSAEGHRPGRSRDTGLAACLRRANGRAYRGFSTVWYLTLGSTNTASRETMTMRSTAPARLVLPRASRKSRRQNRKA